MNNKKAFGGSADRTRETTTGSTTSLKLHVRGLDAMERRLLEAAVKLSKRRTPSLELIPDGEADRADVLMVDTRDPLAVQWARREPGIDKRVVLWVDGQEVSRGHIAVPRPVQWSILPMLIARAMEPHASAENRYKTPGGDLKPIADRNRDRLPADGASILVVDDSLAMRAHLRTLLEARGYEILQAKNAGEALEIAAQHTPACALMDVMMPGTDGYECCRQIKNSTRGAAQTPVIMLTSKSSPFDRIRGKMAGCDAYLTKPVEAEKLYAVLAQHARAADTEVT